MNCLGDLISALHANDVHYILEPVNKLCHHSFCIGTIMDIDLIPFEVLAESFGHPGSGLPDWVA